MSTTFLKKYKVLGKIGEGSFSEVLKCQNKETGLLYAAKRLKKVKESLTDALKTPEVATMRKLKQHPNILHLIETHFDPFPGKVTLIFELMDMSIYDLMKTRKRYLPESRVKNYLFQILKGVEYLHRHGLFHRDIKPENILLKNEVVKLADLGSVRGIFCRPPYTEYISTRWYRSPECLLTTGYYGPKMDIWATGCVFFELITLKPLFPGENEMDQIVKIHNVLGTPQARLVSKFRRHKSRICEFFFPPRSGSGVSALLPNVSDGGKDILKQMLVYDPENRPNVRRLLEHRYFNDLREQETMSRRHSWSFTQGTTSQIVPEWQNQSLLGVAGNEKRRKSKRTATTQRPSGNQKIARVISSPNQHSENTEKINTTQTSITKFSQYMKEDMPHQQLIQVQQLPPPPPPTPPVPPQSIHSQNAKYQLEKTWTSAISYNALASRSSFNTDHAGSKRLGTLQADACEGRNQFRLSKVPVRQQAPPRVLPVRRGPSTITSLPTLEGSVRRPMRGSMGRGVLPNIPPASFLRLPPIVGKKTAATLTAASKSLSETGGNFFSGNVSTRNLLSNRYATEKARLQTIDEKSTVSRWRHL